MKNKTVSITLWYLSVFFLVIGLYYFAMCFIKDWQLNYSIPLAACAVISVIFYIVSYKPLKCDNGYTVLQAIEYYKNCKQKGFAESFGNKDRKILEIASAEMEIMQVADISDKFNFYNEGKFYVENMKNPVILKYWKYRDRLVNRKNRRKDK